MACSDRLNLKRSKIDLGDRALTKVITAGAAASKYCISNIVEPFNRLPRARDAPIAWGSLPPLGTKDAL